MTRSTLRERAIPIWRITARELLQNLGQAVAITSTFFRYVFPAQLRIVTYIVGTIWIYAALTAILGQVVDVRVVVALLVSLLGVVAFGKAILELRRLIRAVLESSRIEGPTIAELERCSTRFVWASCVALFILVSSAGFNGLLTISSIQQSNRLAAAADAAAAERDKYREQLQQVTAELERSRKKAEDLRVPPIDGPAVVFNGPTGGEITIEEGAINVVDGPGDWIIWGIGQDLTVRLKNGEGSLTLKGFKNITIDEKNGPGKLVVGEDNQSVRIDRMDGPGNVYLRCNGRKTIKRMDGQGIVYFRGSPPIFEEFGGAGKVVREE